MPGESTHRSVPADKHLEQGAEETGLHGPGRKKMAVGMEEEREEGEMSWWVFVKMDVGLGKDKQLRWTWGGGVCEFLRSLLLSYCLLLDDVTPE